MLYSYNSCSREAAVAAKDLKNLEVVLPSGITLEDCVRVQDRSGHCLTWSDADDKVLILGKLSVCGSGLSNISMKCMLKGHRGCRCVFFHTSGHIMRQIVCAEQTYVIGTGIDHLIQTDMCGLLDLELCSVALYCVVLFRVSESSRIPGRCRTDGRSTCSKRSIFWLWRQIGLDRVFCRQIALD